MTSSRFDPTTFGSQTQRLSPLGHYLKHGRGSWTDSMDRSWTVPGPFLDLSWTVPGPFLDLSWTFPGPFLDLSWTVPGRGSRTRPLDALPGLGHWERFERPGPTRVQKKVCVAK